MIKTRLTTLMSVRAFLWAALGLFVALSLLGCGGSGGTASLLPQSGNLSGTIMGGRQPVVGSSVYVFDASATLGTPTKQIASATTDGNGRFSIPTFPSPPDTGDLIYVLAVGGNAGGGVNNNAALMSVAGTWNGNAVTHPSLQINELTTVATLAVLQDVLASVPCTSIAGSTATSGTCPSPSSQTAETWSATDASIANWVDVSTGQAASALQTATNPSANYSNYLNLNLLASVMANCINSGGGVAGDNTACGSLFDVANTGSTGSTNHSPAGTLTSAGTPTSTGAYPASVSVSPNGQFVYVANRGDGTVSAFSINSGSGTLNAVGSPTPTGSGLNSNPYSITVSPNGQFAYVANFGDGTVSTFSINPGTGVLSIVGLPISSGYSPVSIAISPNGQFAYVANYFQGTVSTFGINGSTGALNTVGSPTSTGSGPFSYPYSVAISPNGQFAYVANFHDGTVSAFSINPGTGSLNTVGSPTSTGSGLNSTPYSVTVSPNGQFAYVANGNGTVSTFSINPGTGSLSVVGLPISSGYSPVSIAISPNGQFAYVVNLSDGTVSVFSINPSTGALNTVGSPTSTGSGPSSYPYSIVISPNGQFTYVVNSGDGTVSTFSIASGPPTDTVSAFMNLLTHFSSESAALFGLKPSSAAVYAPMPDSAPSSFFAP